MPEDLPYDVGERTFRWEVPEVEDEAVAVAREIVRLGRRYEWWGDRLRWQRLIWTSLHYGLGVPAAALAGASGAIALSSSVASPAAGALALGSAALGTLMTFLNSPKRATDAVAKANACWNVSMQARLYVAADLPGATLATMRPLLADLQERERAALRALSD